MRFFGKLIASLRKRFFKKKKKKYFTKPREIKSPFRRRKPQLKKKTKKVVVPRSAKKSSSLKSHRGSRKDKPSRRSKTSRLTQPKKLPKDISGTLTSSPVGQNRIFVGEITHYFSKIQVCVVKVTHRALSLGDRIHIEGSETSFSQAIESLQIENSDVRVAPIGKLVGLKVKKKVKPGDKVYKV